MKYDLEDGPLSSGIDSRATETACFGGFLFGCLRKRLSIDCRDCLFSFWCPLVVKPSRLLLHKLHAWGFRSDNHRWKNQMPTPSVSCTLEFQIELVRAFLVYSCQREMKRWGIISFLHRLLVSTKKPSEIDMKNDISHPPVGVLVFSFQLAITPPL